eukprot:scaffold7352_cov254-Pinguiococcus_pyrenoidosus.AAC.7
MTGNLEQTSASWIREPSWGDLCFESWLLRLTSGPAIRFQRAIPDQALRAALARRSESPRFRPLVPSQAHLSCASWEGSASRRPYLYLWADPCVVCLQCSMGKVSIVSSNGIIEARRLVRGRIGQSGRRSTSSPTGCPSEAFVDHLLLVHIVQMRRNDLVAGVLPQILFGPDAARLKPLNVGTKPGLSAQINRGVHPQPAWLGHGID